jgi:hypothetical protein
VARPSSSKKAPPRRIAGEDADETEALNVAAATLKGLCPVAQNPQAVASAVISAWIIERMKRHAGARLSGNVVFNLGDAHLIGMLETALPKIGDALAGGGFPFDRTFNELTKEQAVMLFLAGVVAHREVAVFAGEAPSFPFDEPFSDAVPFGADDARRLSAEGEKQFAVDRVADYGEPPF